jgi:hypothetical protein
MLDAPNSTEPLHIHRAVPLEPDLPALRPNRHIDPDRLRAGPDRVPHSRGIKALQQRQQEPIVVAAAGVGIESVPALLAHADPQPNDEVAWGGQQPAAGP